MNDELTFDQAREIVAKSYFLSELFGDTSIKGLGGLSPGINGTSVSGVADGIGSSEYVMQGIRSDEFLSFRILSDDEGGSECGPWNVDVYGACGVWLVSSIDYDDLWFSDRDSAVDAAYGYAHESIIEEIDRGVLSFQQSNSDVDQEKKDLDTSALPNIQKSDPGRRVLGFYLGGLSNQIYRHNKYGMDGKSDFLVFMSSALNSSPSEIALAFSTAQEIKWEEAERALSLVLVEKKRVASLESEIDRLRMSRTREIEVDDWCRRKGISEPKTEDFIKMAAELKPFFHYREASRAWDVKQPSAYQDAYGRVVAEWKRLEDERSRPEEE